MKKLKSIQDEHALTGDQLLTLASDSLRTIVELLARGGALSRREIATMLGRPSASVTYQLKRLVNVGLVIETGRRASERRPEILYGLVANRLSARDAAKSGEGRRALAKSGRRIVSAAGRAFVRALEIDGASTTGPERRAAMRRLVLTLDDTSLGDLNRLMERFVADAEALPRAGRHVVTLTLVMS